MRVASCVLLVVIGSSCRRAPDSAAPPADLISAATPAWFEDVTDKVGLSFTHVVTTNFFMPEHIGSGGAFFDFDNDGRLDVYLVNNGGPDSRAVNRLYHQEADGRFKDVTAGSGLDVTGWGMGVAIGDVNNDGWPDVLLTEYGGVRLFLNNGNGKFIDATRSAALDNPHWATSAAFFDYDRDGWLDLVVANYVDYDPTHKCYDARGAPEYCGPHGFPGSVTKLFRNLGKRTEGNPPSPSDGKTVPVRFDDVTLKSGLARLPGPALGVFCADFDGDHWPDIFLADDGKPNRLFINRRDGTFSEEAAKRGLAFNAMGQTAGNMGIAPGDADGDGLFDLFVTHLSEEQHAFWMQGPRGLFQDHVALAGLARSRWRGTGFGVVMADFDNNGWPDLALLNGRIKRDTPIFSPTLPGLPEFWNSYAQRNQLFANDGQGKFHDVSEGNAALCGAAMVGRGLACGDFDNDGAIDLLATSIAAPVRLYRNVAPKRGHWLLVRAVDPALSGRDAYGAEIVLQAGGRRWWGLVNPAFSYLCSNDPRIHFGLGAVTGVDSIQITWPDGAEEVFAGGAVDRLVVLRKGEGSRR